MNIEQKLKRHEGVSHANMYGKGIAGRGKSQCKGPKASYYAQGTARPVSLDI